MASTRTLMSRTSSVRADDKSENNILLEKAQRRILLKEHNDENLLSMLRLVYPEMTVDQVYNNEVRVNTMKKLLVQIHPNNFPENEDAQNIYEDVQVFYDSCCDMMNDEVSKESQKHKKKLLRRRNNNSPTTVVDLVVQFNIRQKWSWLDRYLRPLPPDEVITSGKVLAPAVAYQCINYRGAIAHGKRPSLIYSWANVESCLGQSVMEVLDKHGGFKTIVGRQVEKIKIEIIENGPVVSFSFTPTSVFAKRNKDSIVHSRIKKHHYCLIVGWKLTEYGEVWLVQSYHGRKLLEVPVGQFSIEETIVAPKDDYVHLTWQQGPYFDIDMSNYKGWHRRKTATLILKSSELEELAGIFDDKSFHEVIKEKVRFVIRDKKKKAHSRSCVTEELKYEKNLKVWKLVCAFNDNGSCPLQDHNCSTF